MDSAPEAKLTFIFFRRQAMQATTADLRSECSCIPGYAFEKALLYMVLAGPHLKRFMVGSLLVSAKKGEKKSA